MGSLWISQMTDRSFISPTCIPLCPLLFAPLPSLLLTNTASSLFSLPASGTFTKRTGREEKRNLNPILLFIQLPLGFWSVSVTSVQSISLCFPTLLKFLLVGGVAVITHCRCPRGEAAEATVAGVEWLVLADGYKEGMSESCLRDVHYSSGHLVQTGVVQSPY